MRTGLMRRMVTIRSMARVSDGMGGYTETPTDVTGIPARVEPLLGSEMLRAMQTGMQRPHRITMRYRTGMTGAKTLLYEGRTFDIKSVVDTEEKHRELIITADEVNAFAVTEVQVPTPPVGPVWRGNEPAGMTTKHDRPWSVLNTGSPYNADSGTAWRDFPDRGGGLGTQMDIFTDATAPRTPSNVARIAFPTATPVGSSPANSFTWDTWTYKTLYVCAAWKCSANWWGCATGANKIFYSNTQTTGQITNLSAVGNGQAQIGIIVQGAAIGNGIYVPSAGQGIITRGQWHQIEFLWVGNDAGVANGTCTVWLDSVQVLVITGLKIEPTIATLFGGLGWDPVWSGGDAVPALQYQYMDQTYVSGKN